MSSLRKHTHAVDIDPLEDSMRRVVATRLILSRSVQEGDAEGVVVQNRLDLLKAVSDHVALSHVAYGAVLDALPRAERDRIFAEADA